MLSVQAAKDALFDATHVYWDEISATQLKQNGRLNQRPNVSLCYNTSGMHCVYLTAKDPLPNWDFYDAIIKIANKYGLQMLPVFKYDISPEAEVFLGEYQLFGQAIYLFFKPSGNLILKPMRSLNPSTYSIGTLHSLNVSVIMVMNSYFSTEQWTIKAIVPSEKATLKLTFQQKITQQSISVTLENDGLIFSGATSISEPNIKYKEWLISGSCGFKVIGTNKPNRTQETLLKQPAITTAFQHDLLGQNYQARMSTSGASLSLITLGSAISLASL